MRKAVKLDNKNLQSLTKLGEVLMREFKNEKELKEAQDYLKSALKLEPYHDEALVCLGRVYEKMNQDNKAIECYKQAI